MVCWRRVGAALAPAGADAAGSRYSFANGCYSVVDTGGKRIAEAVRLKATTLGRYLLYLPDGTFVSAQEGGALAPAAQPSPAADFAVQEAGDAFTLARASTGAIAATVRFSPASGCAEFPEAPLNAQGTPARGGATEYGEVRGTVEGHMCGGRVPARSCTRRGAAACGRSR